MDPDPEERKKRRRNRKPLAFCRWMTQRPGLWFGLTLGGHIVITLINLVLYLVGYDIFPIQFDVFPVEIKTEITYQRYAAFMRRNTDLKNTTRFTIDEVGPTWLRGYSADDVTLFYTADGDNVFQKQYFEQMKYIEDDLNKIDEYQSFCQLEEDLQCKKPVSILRYFDGTYYNISSVFYDPEFDDIPTVLNEAHNHPETREPFKYFLGKGYSISPTNAFSNVTRSAFPIGWPLSNDSTQDMKQIEGFLDQYFEPALSSALDRTTDGLSLNYFSGKLFELEVFPQAMKDMMLAIGSLGFILIFMWIQTGSFWITGWAILSIITCFWITNLIYRTIINYQYLGYFHVIAIFIILGIGADDIFVYFNAWRDTGYEEYPSLAHRLSDCYRRAAGTMFFTSFTTMMAFLVGGISPVMPLGSFGIFTGMLVAVNYISVIVFFPNVVLMHHLYFEKRCCPCCSCPHEDKGITLQKPELWAHKTNTVGDKEILAQKARTSPQKSTKNKHPIVRFFAGPYFRFVTHKIARWIIIIVFVAFLAFFIWSATQIETSAEEIKIYRDNNNYGKAMRLAGTAFIPSGNHFIMLYVVWGLNPVDFSSCHFTDWNCSGSSSYDYGFNMNLPPVQRNLLDFCHKLKFGLDEQERKNLMIRNNSINGELEVDCFMDNLQNFMQEQGDFINATYNVDLDLSYPLTEGNMAPFMSFYPDIYESNLDKDFYRYFEIATSMWINNGYTMLSHPDLTTYDKLLGEAWDHPYTTPVKYHYQSPNWTWPNNGYYGTKLRYVIIRVNLTLSHTELSYKEGLPVFEKWEDFLQEQMSTMEEPLKSGFQVTDYTWHWLVIQQSLERGAWFGIGIGAAIACVVLILATMNIIVGLMATGLIGCVTAGVLGVIPLAGWKIDVMISMNLTLLVGLSVDYIVHLAEGYHLSEYNTRLERVQDMLEHLGISVLSGALTTIGAAMFMLFAKIQFFFQFGTFLFCIIGFSSAFSLMFFPAVLSLIGPENHTGSISRPFKLLHYKVIGRGENDVNCDGCKGKGFIKSENAVDKNLLPNDTSKKDVSNGVIGLCTDNNCDGISDILGETIHSKSNKDTSLLQSEVIDYDIEEEDSL